MLHPWDKAPKGLWHDLADHGFGGGHVVIPCVGRVVAPTWVRKAGWRVRQ